MKITSKKYQSVTFNKDVIEAKLKEENDDDILMLDGLECFSKSARIHNHDTITIGAETGYGKTTLAINLINKSLKSYNVVYFNLDNSERDVCVRLIQNYSNESEITEENREKYYEYLEKNNTSLIVINKNNLNAILAIIQDITSMLNEPLVVVIDTLHNVEHNSTDSYESTKITTNKLRQLTLNNDIIMFNICQFNRNSVKSKSSTIDCDIHSFADASNIEKDSTHVVFFGEKNKKDYIVFKKNRYDNDSINNPIEVKYNRKTKVISECVKKEETNAKPKNAEIPKRRLL